MSDKLSKNRAVIVGVLIFIAVLIGGLVINDNNLSKETVSNNENIASNSIIYDGQDGVDALTLLKSKYETVYTTSEFGSFVTSIDGKQANEKENFWALYINNSLSSVGADKYITKNSDKIEWKLDKIEVF